MLTKEIIIRNLKTEPTWELPENATADEWLLFEEAQTQLLKEEAEKADKKETTADAKKIEDAFFEERLGVIEEFDPFDDSDADEDD